MQVFYPYGKDGPGYTNADPMFLFTLLSERLDALEKKISALEEERHTSWEK